MFGASVDILQGCSGVAFRFADGLSCDAANAQTRPAVDLMSAAMSSFHHRLKESPCGLHSFQVQKSLLWADIRLLVRPWRPERGLGCISQSGDAQSTVIHNTGGISDQIARSVDAQSKGGAMLGWERHWLLIYQYSFIEVDRHAALIACVDEQPKPMPAPKHLQF